MLNWLFGRRSGTRREPQTIVPVAHASGPLPDSLSANAANDTTDRGSVVAVAPSAAVSAPAPSSSASVARHGFQSTAKRRYRLSGPSTTRITRALNGPRILNRDKPRLRSVRSPAVATVR